MSIRPQTITERILARAAGRTEVTPGELVTVRLDLVMANDITGPLAIAEFEKIGAPGVFDRERVVLVQSHFVPAKDIKSAEQSRELRHFARRQQLVNYFEVGEGIEHAILPERGLVLPGMVVIGADSHTCTYGGVGAFATGVGSTDLAAAMATGETWLRIPESVRFVFHGRLRPWVSAKDLILFIIGQIGVDGALYQAMEFAGQAIGSLSVNARLTLCNMAIEAGAKCGVVAPDEVTLRYLEQRNRWPYSVTTGDADAVYQRVWEWDASDIEPQVAFPHLPSNTRPLSQVGEVRLDQVVIGSCTNGRIEDLRQAAVILRNRKVHPGVRTIVIPASRSVYLQAMREGLLEIFAAAGASVSPPTCGPCLGGYMGILAAGERCLATTNRNFVGRMGHPQSEVYLAGPAVAAASAILGRIAAPEEVGAQWVA